jgi:hypothetical protein
MAPLFFSSLCRMTHPPHPRPFSHQGRRELARTCEQSAGHLPAIFMANLATSIYPLPRWERVRVGGKVRESVPSSAEKSKIRGFTR